MTLKNLLGISLDAIQLDAAAVGKLLAAAQRNLAGAQLAESSPENRFDAAFIPDAVAAECLAGEQALQRHVLAWLMAGRPDLLPG